MQAHTHSKLAAVIWMGKTEPSCDKKEDVVETLPKEKQIRIQRLPRVSVSLLKLNIRKERYTFFLITQRTSASLRLRLKHMSLIPGRV